MKTIYKLLFACISGIISFVYNHESHADSYVYGDWNCGSSMDVSLCDGFKNANGNSYHMIVEVDADTALTNCTDIDNGSYFVKAEMTCYLCPNSGRVKTAPSITVEGPKYVKQMCSYVALDGTQVDSVGRARLCSYEGKIPTGTTVTATGADSITDCYIPANTSKSDSTGTYQFNADCYYTE